MIRRISSDINSFKSLDFHPGLNILVAEKSKTSTSRDSRNGAGKTSLVTLIDFLMGGTTSNGGSAHNKGILRSPDLASWTFKMSFDLGGQDVTISRSGGFHGKVHALGDPAAWPIEPKFYKGKSEYELRAEEWRTVLAKECFGVRSTDPDAPSFRQLFPYFARRDMVGGFTTPVQHATRQQEPDVRFVLSFLLGLDWRIATEFEKLRKEKEQLRELRRAFKQGVLQGPVESSSKIRSRLLNSRRKSERLEQNINDFRVVPEYSGLSDEADDITQKIRTLNDEDTIDRKTIKQVETALTSELPPEHDELGRLYEEAGVILPDTVHRRFQEVRAFHERIVSNRKTHLTVERDDARSNLERRALEREALDSRRSELLGILRSGGALENFNKLQAEAVKLRGETDELDRQYDNAKKLEKDSSDFKSHAIELERRLALDMDDRSEQIDEAVSLFTDYYERQRKTTAALLIEPSDIGPRFRPEADDQESRGVLNSLTFSLDMVIATLWAKKKGARGPGFLVHDSHLFSDMDERQVAHALQLGAELSAKHGFQYIVTMNSDALPDEGFEEGFEIKNHILPVRLTDEPTGGIFGFRFAAHGDDEEEF